MNTYCETDHIIKKVYNVIDVDSNKCKKNNLYALIFVTLVTGSWHKHDVCISIVVHVYNSIIYINNIIIKKHKNRINIIIVRLNELMC